MALEGGEIGRALVAEGDRHRLLQVAAAGHRRVAVFLRQRRERVGNIVDVLLDDREALADLHDGRGVGDVLGGGAPVAPFAETALAEIDELRDHRQHRIADPLGLLLQLLDVELVELAVLEDFVAGLLRDDAQLGLRAREAGLEVEILLDAVAVRPHLPHGLGAENVAEDGGVDGAGGHGWPFTSGRRFHSRTKHRCHAPRIAVRRTASLRLPMAGHPVPTVATGSSTCADDDTRFPTPA